MKNCVYLLFLAMTLIIPVRSSESAHPLSSFSTLNSERICVSDLTVLSVISTGETTGQIATMTVENNSDQAIPVQAESFYIPADGKYQPYFGRIPENIVIPPGGESAIPVNGFCVDVGKPPVTAGEAFQSIDNWVSVGKGPSGDEVSLIPGDPLPPYTPTNQKMISSSDAFQEGAPLTFNNITATWPGEDKTFNGTIDLDEDPEVIAPLIVEIVERVELATEDIMENDDFTTPISADPDREAEAIAQQTIWIVMGAITGNPYTKDDFTERVHEQFETNTGNSVSSLPDEEQENMQTGVNKFWDTFTATGVDAKVIKSPGHMLTVSPQCECEDIDFHVTVERNNIEVHNESHTTENKSTSNSVKIEVPALEMGDEFEVKISDISVNCDCNAVECEFYPAKSTNSGSPGYTTPDETKPGKVNIIIENDDAAVAGENHNCSTSDNEWNSEGDEYSMKITTRDERTNNAAVFQRFYIKAYCQLEDCRKDLCKRRIQLNFVEEN